MLTVVRTMKIASAEFPDEIALYGSSIDLIARHVESSQPDLLVLPEMPFTPWVFHTEVFDQTIWDRAVEDHEKWLHRCFQAVQVPMITSRPVNVESKRLNQAIFLDTSGKVQPLRSKFYLPNQFPAVEVPWFDEGDKPGEVFELLGHRIGVQLCSELMFAEVPRILGANGATIIIQSRATGDHPRWRAASVLSASTSGAFVVGSNRRSVDRDWFTGGSWVYGPDGMLIAETTEAQPIITVEINGTFSDAAQHEYPLPMFRDYRSE